MPTSPCTNHYFVDEAGDLSFFDKRGRIIVGTEGVSRFFMVGVAHIPNPLDCHQKLESLRQSLINDPYFKDVPSMQPDACKTASCFHAKDDLPEVRREVFKLLPTFNVKIQVVIRRKLELATAAQLIYQQSGQKLKPDTIYDDLVARLFRNVLHTADQNHITFAHRGKSARDEALKHAIARAKRNFGFALAKRRFNPEPLPDRPTHVVSMYPSQCAGLQVVDYYLWTLQRLFERQEDRFFDLLAAGFKLVMDLDDTRNKPYGEWYSRSNPLASTKIKPCIG